MGGRRAAAVRDRSEKSRRGDRVFQTRRIAVREQQAECREHNHQEPPDIGRRPVNDGDRGRAALQRPDYGRRPHGQLHHPLRQ